MEEILIQSYINEKKAIEKIYSKCNKESFIVEDKKSEDKKICSYKIENLGYVYALKNVYDDTKQIDKKDSIIISPIKLKEISQNDFEEDNYFKEYDNIIGYGTEIKSGVWILSKENEIRYTVKDEYKKYAVIQLKLNTERNISSKYFSYSTKIEKEIEKNLYNSKSILETISKTNLGRETYKIEQKLENKSLKILINSLSISLDGKSTNIQDNHIEKKSIEEKIQGILQKYEHVYNNLKLERENMVSNFYYEGPVEKEKQLITLESRENVTNTASIFIKIMKKLFSYNTVNLRNNLINFNGGKNE